MDETPFRAGNGVLGGGGRRAGERGGGAGGAGSSVGAGLGVCSVVVVVRGGGGGEGDGEPYEDARAASPVKLAVAAATAAIVRMANIPPPFLSVFRRRRRPRPRLRTTLVRREEEAGGGGGRPLFFVDRNREFISLTLYILEIMFPAFLCTTRSLATCLFITKSTVQYSILPPEDAVARSVRVSDVSFFLLTMQIE